MGELVSVGEFLNHAAPEIWERVMLELDVVSLWRMAGVCAGWRDELRSERFWKCYCSRRGWDYERHLRRMAKKEVKRKENAKTFRRKYLPIFGCKPYGESPVRLYARSMFLKTMTRLMKQSLDPKAKKLLKNRRAFTGTTKELVDQVLQIDANYVPFLNLKAMSLFDRDAYLEAIQLLERAVGLYPWYTEALHNLGFAYHELDRLDEALFCYTRVVLLDGDAVSFNNRGLLLSDLGENAKAVDDFSTIINFLKPSADAYNNRAFSYNRLGEYELATQDCLMVSRMKPHLAEPYRIRAFALLKLGRLEEAMHAVEMAIQLKGEKFYAVAVATRSLIFEAMAAQVEDDEERRWFLSQQAKEDMEAALEKCPDVLNDV